MSTINNKVYIEQYTINNNIEHSSLLLICFIYKTQVSAPGCRCSIKYYEMNDQIIDRHTLPMKHKNRLILVHVHRERSHEKNGSFTDSVLSTRADVNDVRTEPMA